jgi:hypothetical protein
MPESLDRSELNEFAAKLRTISGHARKLLAQAAGLAYGVHHEERRPDVAYLPELHESCGLDVEAMYEVLRELETAGLIDLEGEYPFQDVKLREGELRAVVERCRALTISVHEVVGELRFDLLS